jgi:DNA polymerase III epsilon subunit-like protein
MILFFDTETTGLVDWKSPANASHQPRLVQFAALLTDDEGNEEQSVSLIIKPEGFVIPEVVSALHGITQEKALRQGVPCEAVRLIFHDLCSAVSLLVAHNIKFDQMVMATEFARAGTPFPDLRSFCTMQAMTPICALPGRYGDYKWPKLQEAHKRAFGIEFDNAHNALADVQACAKVYFWHRALQNDLKPEIEELELA